MTRGPLPNLSAHAVQPPPERGFGLHQWIGLLLGPAMLLLVCTLSPPDGLSEAGWRTAGVAALMATFWMLEVVPIPVTALMPLVLFPLLGLSDGREAAAPYSHPLIFLFLGGFLLALAMQRWGLHRRVAINLITMMGTRPTRIVAGFLLAAALISMWVSNTATALMMLPIAVSVVQLLPKGPQASPNQEAFAAALMLAVAYGATTGGIATLIGTPPNALLAAYMDSTYGIRIGFAQWMALGLPITLVALPVVYLVLTRGAFRVGQEEVPGLRDLLQREKASLGKPTRAEVMVASVFVLTAAGWIMQPLIAQRLPLFTDTTIAMIGALMLFVIPVEPRRGLFLMNWESAKALPWDVLLLFGGGLSLANQIEKHGLSSYLGHLSGGLNGVPVMLAVATISLGILLLTELTSNTATAATFLPVVASVAVSLGQSPLLFVIPTALAASCSYMLPVGTPPNAIVFGSGYVRLPDMARAGLLLNLLLIPVIVGILWILGPIVFGIELHQLPEWARS